MSVGASDYYLVTKKLIGLKPGSVIRINNNIASNIENGKNFIFEDKDLRMCTKLSDGIDKCILKFNIKERLDALLFIHNTKNKYLPKLKLEIFMKKYENTVIKYYLIPSKFYCWKSGSVFAMAEKNIIDLDRKDGSEINEKIPSNWIEIANEIKDVLLGQKQNKRVKYYHAMIKNSCGVRPINISTVVPSEEVKYYLIPEKFCAWDVGCIFRKVNGVISECQTRVRTDLKDMVPPTWIEIPEKYKEELITKRKHTRVDYYNNHLKTPNSSFTANTFLPKTPNSSFTANTLLPKTPNSSFTANTLLPKTPNSSFTANTLLPKSSDNASNLMLSAFSLPKSLFVQPQNEYFESTVIIPNSVIDVQKLTLKGWIPGERVYFNLLESGTRYDGTLRWTGIVNGVNSAAVDILRWEFCDPLSTHRCLDILIARLNFSSYTNVVLVRINALHQSVANYSFMEKYFTKLYGSLTDSVLATEIFDNAQQMRDPKLVKSLVRNCPQAFLYDLCSKLMSTSTNSLDEFSQITGIIQRIPKSQNNDLLKLAKVSLTSKNDALFNVVMAQCSDRNICLDNGETFLTDLIKGLVGEESINTAITKKLFDINKPNSRNETPLILACGRLLVASVRLLVDLNANIDHDNSKALDVAFAAKKGATNMDQIKKVIEVIEILTTATKPETNICTICMDKKINTVFNCGHNACRSCADQLAVCHFCKKAISSRIPLFLS